MTFFELAKYLENLEKTSSRIEITKILSELFKKTDKGEIDKTVYLLLGTLAPSYRGIVFNLAERMMLQVISDAFKTDLESVKKLYKRKGDLGEVAQDLGKSRSKSKVTVTDVYHSLFKIAKDEGEGSQDRKVKATSKLLSELDGLSARFVARIPVGKLRLGFSDKTILDALSWMETGGKTKKAELEKAYNVFPDVGLLAKKVKEKGIEEATKDVKPVVGVPVLPMLAQRLKSPKEMIEKMREVFVEPKFDGLRIQLHFDKSGFDPASPKAARSRQGKVKAFTRNLNESSWMFPELKGLEKSMKAESAVLDCEAMGVDEKRRALVNFQTTMTRRRKHKIKEISKSVSIKFYVFDILLKNGKSLMDLPYKQRRNILEETVKSGKLLELVDYKITKDPERIKRLIRQELKEGMEGIIVKRADSKYVAGRTGWRWVKMKEEEGAKAKLADTIDCVVMGYYTGRGKRTQFGIGGFLVGIPGKQKILTLTKVGTGLTDEQFRELKKRLSGLEIKKRPKEYVVDKNIEPDFWVEPDLVVELAADEITQSPIHTSGYALRFPRLVKFRDDKDVSQATTVSEIKKLFRLQGSMEFF